jgi:ABC-type dipeptide/oligopeptide/nickel transport system permease component
MCQSYDRRLSDLDFRTGGYQALPVTSWVAVVAFVCSVLGVWFAGIPMGIYAQREIDRSGGRLIGRGFATAAIVIGLIEVVLMIIVIIVIVSSINSINSGA